jgi:hypothetical protein
MSNSLTSSSTERKSPVGQESPSELTSNFMPGSERIIADAIRSAVVVQSKKDVNGQRREFGERVDEIAKKRRLSISSDRDATKAEIDRRFIIDTTKVLNEYEEKKLAKYAEVDTAFTKAAADIALWQRNQKLWVKQAPRINFGNLPEAPATRRRIEREAKKRAEKRSKA